MVMPSRTEDILKKNSVSSPSHTQIPGVVCPEADLLNCKPIVIGLLPTYLLLLMSWRGGFCSLLSGECSPAMLFPLLFL